LSLALLAAGASKGIVHTLQSSFKDQNAIEINGIFNAVGAIREIFLSGAPCDVLISTAAQIAALTAQGLLRPGSAAALGAVQTGVAVPAGRPLPDILTPAQLRAALLESEAIFLPDPYQSTAGIHFMAVLDKLGIKDELVPRLQAFPNGATAMRHLAESSAVNAIGSTQITEIKYTAGLSLLGPLPNAFALSTVYAAAVSTKAHNVDQATAFVSLLTGPQTHMLREAAGFEQSTV